MSDSAPELSRLLQSARGGTDDVLGTVFEAYRAFLLTVANRRLDPALRAKGGASDIVQDTFLEAQRDFARFHGTTESELKAWLVRLLLNNLVNFARHYKETAKRQVDCEVWLPTGSPSSGEGGANLVDGGPPPSARLMADERAATLRNALDRLPEDYRRVIVLRNQEDRPFEEIAGLMRRSENAVRQLWLRAIERLRDELGETV